MWETDVHMGNECTETGELGARGHSGADTGGGPSTVQRCATGARRDTEPEEDGEFGHRLGGMQKSTGAKAGLLVRGAGTAGEPFGKGTRKHGKLLVTWM